MQRSVQALCTEQENPDRQAIRSAIEKASPGLLAFLDLAKAKFPNARLTGLAIQQQDDLWAAVGELHNPGTKDGR